MQAQNSYTYRQLHVYVDTPQALHKQKTHTNPSCCLSPVPCLFKCIGAPTCPTFHHHTCPYFLGGRILPTICAHRKGFHWGWGSVMLLHSLRKIWQIPGIYGAHTHTHAHARTCTHTHTHTHSTGECPILAILNAAGVFHTNNVMRWGGKLCQR